MQYFMGDLHLEFFKTPAWEQAQALDANLGLRHSAVFPAVLYSWAIITLHPPLAKSPA